MKLSSRPAADGSRAAVEQIDYGMKPTIVHQFRQPEKRPPAAISDAFTIAALAPALLLLIAVGFVVEMMPLRGRQFRYRLRPLRGSLNNGKRKDQFTVER